MDWMDEDVERFRPEVVDRKYCPLCPFSWSSVDVRKFGVNGVHWILVLEVAPSVCG